MPTFNNVLKVIKSYSATYKYFWLFVIISIFFLFTQNWLQKPWQITRTNTDCPNRIWTLIVLSESGFGWETGQSIWAKNKNGCVHFLIQFIERQLIRHFYYSQKCTEIYKKCFSWKLVLFGKNDLVFYSSCITVFQ